VRVISNRPIREFCASRKADGEIAARDFATWRKIAEAAAWRNHGDLKQTFGSADRVGNCTVFDVGNNRFRLIGRVNFGTGMLYVLAVMDHKEYDRGKWIDACGCNDPPPTKPESRRADQAGREPKSEEGAMIVGAPDHGLVGDSYFDLVRRFPLMGIRDDDHLDQAVEVIHNLLRQDRDDGEEAYLEALSILVESYEKEHDPTPDASPAEVLRELMRSNGLSQTKLSRAVHIAQSTISAILGGERSMTTSQITALAAYFKVKPAAFLPKP